MKIAYFDCPSGISGNMILGALLDTGLDKDYLNQELLKILNPKSEIRNEFQIRITKVKKHGISGTHVEVKPKKEKTFRNLEDILGIINKSRLSKQVKFLGSRIFKRLAEAEAKVHGIPVNKVHFHEVGAVDAIIDIVGACIGIEKLGIEKIYCSPLPSGKGKIVHAHGLLPNPSPAAAELLKGVPTYSAGIKGELVTPTGAAIITTLADSFGDLPRMKVESIGYGAGTMNLPIPNLLRIFIGEAEIPAERDAVLQIETNIDDMDPKHFPQVIARLMKAGALDAYVQPILMKKKRQGFNLVVLCAPEKRDEILDELFTRTTTFGARVYVVPREKLPRKFIKIKTRYGKARTKLGLLGGRVKTIAPEYEDYKLIAKKHRIPIQKVYREIRTSL
jgi:hypothetical protein